MLTSFTKTYWLALLSSLEGDELEKLSIRVDLIEPGVGIPRLSGEKCVYHQENITASEMAGLMQTVFIATAGLVPKEVTRSWRELGDTAVRLWEQDNEIRSR